MTYFPVRLALSKKLRKKQAIIRWEAKNNSATSVVDSKILNLDLDPDFWPNLDPDPDPGPNPGPGL